MPSRGNKYTNAWDRGKPKLKDKKNTVSDESWGISYGDAAVYGLGLAASAALGLYVASVRTRPAPAPAPAAAAAAAAEARYRGWTAAAAHARDAAAAAAAAAADPVLDAASRGAGEDGTEDGDDPLVSVSADSPTHSPSDFPDEVSLIRHHNESPASGRGISRSKRDKYPRFYRWRENLTCVEAGRNLYWRALKPLTAKYFDLWVSKLPHSSRSGHSDSLLALSPSSPPSFLRGPSPIHRTHSESLELTPSGPRRYSPTLLRDPRIRLGPARKLYFSPPRALTRSDPYSQRQAAYNFFLMAAAAHRASHHPPLGGLVGAAAPGLSSEESAKDEEAARRHLSNQEQLAVFREVVEEMIADTVGEDMKQWLIDTMRPLQYIPPAVFQVFSGGNTGQELKDEIQASIAQRWREQHAFESSL